MFERQIRLGFLWLVMVVAMGLHAAYSLSALRYGVDVRVSDATGAVPWSNTVIKTIFYVLPLLVSVGCIVYRGAAWRRFNFGLAVVFMLSNLAHLAQQGSQDLAPLPVAQTILLLAIVVINVPLLTLGWQHLRARPGT